MTDPRPSRRPNRGFTRSGGFTMIELLVTLAILGVILTFGMPALNNFIARSKLEGIARQTASLMQLARFEAIKKSGTARVVVDYATDEVYAFYDADPAAGPVFDPAVDRELGRYKLPNGVSFWAGTDTAPEGNDALENFDDSNSCSGTCPPGGWEEFRSDGTAAKEGAIRFGDVNKNYLELRVVTTASGRTEIRKFDPTDNKYYLQGEDKRTWKWN